MRYFTSGSQPPPRPREKRYPCKPSCCKTPHFCAKNRQCDCHREEKT